LVRVARDESEAGPNKIVAESTLAELTESVKVFHLLAPNGMVLRVERHGMDETDTLSPGEKVVLWWKPEDAVLLEIVD
jgi:hypothetical protein